MKESRFLDWLSGATIYIGYARYGQLGGHGFVVASRYSDDEHLQQAVEDLDAGDVDALHAAERIEAMECWYANDPDPVVAMAKLMDKMREAHLQISLEQQLLTSQGTSKKIARDNSTV